MAEKQRAAEKKTKPPDITLSRNCLK